MPSRSTRTACSVLGFQNDPGMDRVLGATAFLIDTLTGSIVESDIFFNSLFLWSTSRRPAIRFGSTWNRSRSMKSVTFSVSDIRRSGKRSSPPQETGG